ncbi:MAG: hypothetical protein P4L84_00700 [Isosphaeraceae bacterium]|nr:hypothetical protein [Isosphaeraceae bacterium]
MEFAPAPPPPPEETPPPPFNVQDLVQDWSKARGTAAFASALMYAAAVFASMDPKADRRFARAFGPEPLGMSPQLFVLLLLAILSLPLPWVLSHYIVIFMQARRDGLPALGLAGLLYLFDVDQYHPHLRRSKWICMGGLLYFVLISGAWIVYTVRLGV